MDLFLLPGLSNKDKPYEMTIFFLNASICCSTNHHFQLSVGFFPMAVPQLGWFNCVGFPTWITAWGHLWRSCFGNKATHTFLYSW